MKSKFQSASHFLLKTKKGWVTLIVLIVTVLLIFRQVSGSQVKTEFQTGTVSRGGLVSTVTGSGQVASSNSVNITTYASGVVKSLYIKNDDMVKTGDKIAELDLDLVGRQRQAQALSSYQSAQNNVQSAQSAQYSAQSDMLTKWDKYMQAATSDKYQNSDGSPKSDQRTLVPFMTNNDDWLAAEGKYKTAQAAVTQAQVALSSAWYSYQQSSSTIYAPLTGKVSGLSLQIGSVINANSASDNSPTSTKIGSVVTEAAPMVTINLTQIDVSKIKIGNRATVVFDAFPDKTFTGVVVSIDTTGVTSSGVTNYPTYIKLDVTAPEILPNMTLTANIILDSRADVLKVPSAAVKSATNGLTTVETLTGGKTQTVTVQTGLTSDSETEITSGLVEGQTVITGTTTTGKTITPTTSIFGGFGGGTRTSGGNNAVRIRN